MWWCLLQKYCRTFQHSGGPLEWCQGSPSDPRHCWVLLHAVRRPPWSNRSHLWMLHLHQLCIPLYYFYIFLRICLQWQNKTNIKFILSPLIKTDNSASSLWILPQKLSSGFVMNPYGAHDFTSQRKETQFTKPKRTFHGPTTLLCWYIQESIWAK